MKITGKDVVLMGVSTVLLITTECLLPAIDSGMRTIIRALVGISIFFLIGAIAWWLTDRCTEEI